MIRFDYENESKNIKEALHDANFYGRVPKWLHKIKLIHVVLRVNVKRPSTLNVWKLDGRYRFESIHDKWVLIDVWVLHKFDAAKGDTLGKEDV